MTDLRLRYVIDGTRKTISLMEPDGSWQPLASMPLAATRQFPEAEERWRALLGDVIEAAAETNP